MIQAFVVGRLYRITRGHWQNAKTMEFLRKKPNGNLVFALPGLPERLGNPNYRFEWEVRPEDILQARELTADEAHKLR